MDVSLIEAKVIKLIDKHNTLEKSCKDLQKQVDLLQHACKRLQSKKNLAVASVEKIVEQLKTLEKQS